MNMELNPQNPYGSYVVAASAGCGKTYQLSRRFLYLVGAGADPHSILTITFTTKAAAEMRERILQEAARLLHDTDAGHEFAKELNVFYRGACDQADAVGFVPAPPKTPQQVGAAILAATQLLRISTIDSVFMDWVRKFAWEASEENDDEGSAFPPGFTVLSAQQEKRLSYEAWRNTLLHKGDGAAWDELNFLELKSRVQQLAQHDSLLWLVRSLRQMHGDTTPAIMAIPEPEIRAESKDFWTDFADAVTELLRDCKKEHVIDELRSAITAKDFSLLQECKIITGKMALNKQTFGKKLQEMEAYQRADALLTTYINGVRLRQLNAAGAHLGDLYGTFAAEREREKRQRGLIEFADTGKGAFRLFNSDNAYGAQFLIHQQIQHLLLDEFQDTSLLQWMIFHLISAEKLAGRGIEIRQEGVWPTVFIVGDEEQSIYGFREADPTILNTAAEKLAELGSVKVPLNRSFRTCQVVLNYINSVFAERMENFLPHETATRGATPVVPNHGGVWLPGLFPDQSREDEARYVARFIKNAVSGTKPFYVAAKGPEGKRVFTPLKLSDCVLLYRYSTHAGVYEAALREEGIECQRLDGKGFFARAEVADLKALVRFLAFPQDHLALAQILRSPLGRVDDATLNAWLDVTREKGGISRTHSIIAAMGASYGALRSTLQVLLRDRDLMLPFPLLVKALQRMGAFAAYRSAWPGQEGILAAANVQKFLELCSDAQRDGVGHWPHLLQHLDDASTAEQVGNAAVGTDAVTLMTIHKAKGLEYPLVVLVDAAGKMDKTDVYWAKTGHGIYYVGTKDDQPRDYPAFDAVYEEIKDNISLENERLLYVALTRASQYLLITGHGKDASHGFWEQVQSAMESLNVTPELWLDHSTWSIQAELTELPQMEASPEKAAPPAYVIPNRQIQQEVYTLAPHRMLTRGDGGVVSPHRAAFSAAYGQFVHEALEYAVRGQEFDAAEAWARLVGDESAPLAAEAFASAQLEVTAVLADAQWRALWQSAKVAEVEMPIIHLEQGVLVRGSVDLCVFREDESIDIIDYKTTEEAPTDDTDGSWRTLCEKHGYDAQLDLYMGALAAMHPGAPIKSGIYFTAKQKLVWLSDNRH